MKYLILAVLLATATLCYGQPSNNTCANATPLTLGNGTCVTMVGTNIGATSTPGLNPNCGWYNGGDIWYSFVAPAGGAVIIETFDDGSGTFLDTDMALYNTCGGTQLACNASTPPGTSATLNLTGLTPGATYYIAVWEYFNDTAGNFFICAYSPPNTPANDECANATPVLISSTLACGSTVSGTVASATPSPQAVSCGGDFNDDVWYSFVATDTEHQITVNYTGGTTRDLVFQLSTGTCGALTEIYCHDVPDVGWTADMLTIGTTYYIRIASFTTTSQNTTFDVCVATIPSVPPPNDDCVNATPLPVGGPTCTTPLTVHLAAATTSQEVHTCANYMGGDIWFSFVAPLSGTATVETSDVNNIFADTGIAIYDACGGGNLLDCDDDDGFGFYSESILTGLTPGATYYIAVWEGFNDAIISFNICVFDPNNSSSCPNDYAFSGSGGLTGSESGTADYETDGPVESVQTIMNGARVDYDSKLYVLMTNGFIANQNADFNAFIDGCNGGAGGLNLDGEIKIE